ncbi:MAG: hypothetical protein ACI4U6_02095, partial [Acutalibacteraceae bacterium]
MNTIRKNIATRIYAMMLCIALILSAFPVSIITAFAANTNDMGTLTTLSQNGTVNSTDPANIIATFDSTTLDWSPMDTSIGRYQDGWWVGVKMTAPDSLKVKSDFVDGDIQKVTYRRGAKSDLADAEVKSFWNAQDSNINNETSPETRFLTMWVPINEQILNDYIAAGKNYIYYYEFDWNNDSVYEQRVSIVINTNVTLKKDGQVVHSTTVTNDKLATVETITGGVVIDGSQTNIVTATHNDITELTWAPEDESIYRPADGWWVGIKINAPAHLQNESDFTGVYYQSNSNGAWSENRLFWTYKDSSDTATSHYITCWGGINEDTIIAAKEAGTKIVKQWRFDWNKDGVFEQQVRLVIDPNKVVLNAQNGEQVYPYLGTVTPLTGGTVQGNTENLELVIEEASLTWSDVDLSIGRVTAGWYVGMKVTAPEGYTAEQLQNSKYNNRSSNLSRPENDYWGDWRTNDSSFWNNKDSANSATEHFIYMWVPITKGAFDAYLAAGKPIASQYVFDWNNDGVREQTITIKVIPSENIVLNKVEQTGFGFETPAPVDQWVGQTYTNTASGGNGTGAISYSIIEGSQYADINSSTGEVTFKGIGTVKIQATKAADDVYKSATAEYTVKSIKYPQAIFKFENSNPSIDVEFKTGEYINKATGGSGEGSVSYEIVSGSGIASINANTGKVTFIKAGQVTIKATKAADDSYIETTATYTLNITKSEQGALSVNAPASITFSTDAQDVLSVSVGS